MFFALFFVTGSTRPWSINTRFQLGMYGYIIGLIIAILATISTVMIALHRYQQLKSRRKQRRVSSSHNVYTVPTQAIATQDNPSQVIPTQDNPSQVIPAQESHEETICQEITSSQSKTPSQSGGSSIRNSVTGKLLKHVKSKLKKDIGTQNPGINIPTTHDADNLDDWESGPCTINPTSSSETMSDTSVVKTEIFVDIG